MAQGLLSGPEGRWHSIAHIHTSNLFPCKTG